MALFFAENSSIYNRTKQNVSNLLIRINLILLEHDIVLFFVNVLKSDNKERNITL